MVRTSAAFGAIGITFVLLLSAAYAQISSLPPWTAFRLCLAIALPVSSVATLVLWGLSRSGCRMLEQPGASDAELVRAAMMLRRLPRHALALEISRWICAFGPMCAMEQPGHWQPVTFFLFTLLAGPLALTIPLAEWCTAPATAELWQAMHARGVVLAVPTTRLAGRLSFYSASMVTAVASYFASFAFAVRFNQPEAGSMLVSILIFSSSALFFALLTAFVFSTTFTRPLLEMSEVVSRISNDDELAHIGRVPLRQGDEIGTLALLTNTMIDRLERTAAERSDAVRAMDALNQTLECRVEDRTRELSRVQAIAVTNAHRAGMAEISANVLHNVGNVLNSVNVSCAQLETTLRESRASSLWKVTEMLRAHLDSLPSFFATDPKGRLVPAYLVQAGAAVHREHGELWEELARLKSKVHLINTVISAQQQYASGSYLTERTDITQLVEEILAMQEPTLRTNHVRVVKQVQPVDPVPIQRTKLAHVLFNLVKNAEEAMADTIFEDRVLTIEVGGAAQPFIHVRDTGVGIPAEHMTKIFEHGFTTKPSGHGFGLHSSINSMQEMGGTLTVHSDGVGRGSRFTLMFAT